MEQDRGCFHSEFMADYQGLASDRETSLRVVAANSIAGYQYRAAVI